MKRHALLAIAMTVALAVYSQREENVVFSGQDTLHYGATLTFPQGVKKAPAVVIMSGTNPQDRDGTMAGHKVFKEIADYLTAHGIAVLRMDDRGVGETNGNYADATTADFADDCLAAISYLKSRKDIDKRRIGAMGHSEGGATISIAASMCKDFRFLISLAGLMTDGLSSLIRQNYDIVHSSPIPQHDMKRYDEINDIMFHKVYEHAEADSATLAKILWDAYDEWKVKDDAYFKTLNIEFDHFRFPIYMYTMQATSRWYRFFIRYNPADYLCHVNVPVLAINGTKDIMVNCEQNLANARRFLAHNKNVTTVAVDNVNHLLLPCEKGTQDEYKDIKEPVSEEVLSTIVDWLRKNRIIK